MNDLSATPSIADWADEENILNFSSTSLYAPSTRDLIYLFVGATLLRFLLSLALATHLHIPFWLTAYFGDGGTYLRYASFIAGRSTTISNFELRLFPGFPVLIAAFVKLGANLEYTGLSLSWISGGVAAAAAAMLYRDRRVGIATALLLPEYLLCTSHPQSEGPMLALGLVGLVLAMRNRPLAGGILLGLAGTMRPLICFAVLGFAAAAILKKNWRAAIIVCLSSLLVVGLALVLMHHFFGDALKGVRIYAHDQQAYAGSLITWPGKSLVMTPIYLRTAPPLKLAYVWGHVLLATVGCVLIVRRRLKLPSALNVLSMIWLLGNTFFAVLVGGPWGFELYARLLVPAEPALFWAYERWLPRRARWWILIGAASFIQAAINTSHQFHS